MTSASLTRWKNDRTRRLVAVEGQCAATLATAPTAPDLADENLRGYVLLLAAHFQGFCRDLHSDCARAVAAASPPHLRRVILVAFEAARELDRGNPRYQVIRDDFERYDVDLTPALAADPTNAARITLLNEMNLWRNFAAHHKTQPPNIGSLTLPSIQSWRRACDGLARALDEALYNHLSALLGAPPW